MNIGNMTALQRALSELGEVKKEDDEFTMNEFRLGFSPPITKGAAESRIQRAVELGKLKFRKVTYQGKSTNLYSFVEPVDSKSTGKGNTGSTTRRKKA